MSTQTAENRSQTTPEVLPAAQIDHDALYEVVKRLRRNGRVMVKHIEAGSADVHRDLAGMRAALEAADELLDPMPRPHGPEDAIVLYARSVRPKDSVWWNYDAGEGQWHEVRGVHPHDLHPDTMVQLNVLRPDTEEPGTIGLLRDEAVAVRRPEEGSL